MIKMIPDGRSARAQTKRNARREIILKVAQEVIAKKGYQATSVADVIEGANVSRGTFYLYFESREALFHELIDHFIAELMGCIKAVHIEEGNPMAQLYANLKRTVDLLFNNRELTAILLREAVGQGELVDRKLEELNTFLLRMVSLALLHGERLGMIRKVNSRVVAMAIIGSIKEVLYQYLVIKKIDIPDPEVLAHELLEFGVRGLQPDSRLERNVSL